MSDKLGVEGLRRNIYISYGERGTLGIRKLGAGRRLVRLGRRYGRYGGRGRVERVGEGFADGGQIGLRQGAAVRPVVGESEAERRGQYISEVAAICAELLKRLYCRSKGCLEIWKIPNCQKPQHE